jgi:hypothetical protein
MMRTIKITRSGAIISEYDHVDQIQIAFLISIIKNNVEKE